MREPVIASRRSRRTAVPAGGVAQRPARRASRAAGQFKGISARALFAYALSALKAILAILCVVTLIVGYRVAASASLFQVRGVDVSGTSRTSAEEIAGLARRAVARTGVWRADLSAISAELGRLPGVRRAIVTRVLPDRLRIRITERVPVAVVRTSTGHFVWVDDEGVALGEMKPSDQMPPFFIRGWNEDGTDEAGKENIERVQKYLELAREWQAIGLSERVSEVNLIDVRDVRAQLAGNDSQIEVRLGGQDLGTRLKTALDVLDEYKQTPRGNSITYVDLQGSRVVVRFSSGSNVSAVPPASSETSPSETSVNAGLPDSARPAINNPFARRGPEMTSTSSNRAREARPNTTRERRPGKEARQRPR